MSGASDVPLSTLLMLGHAFQQSVDFRAALRDISPDPVDWLASGIPVAVYSSELAKQMADTVPDLIVSTGKRPAEAVAHIIQYAFRYGVEVGHRLADGAA